METEFEEYWRVHQKRLILKAPKELRDEYMESTRLDSPVDWACFVVPIALGIVLQPQLHLQSEILSWGLVVVVVVVAFVLMQMLKPCLQKKKSTMEVLKSIKQYYYGRYKKGGLGDVEPWG